MITVNGQSLDLTYTSGIATDFAEQPGATLSVDLWGMDTITRRYTGRLDKVATELAKYKRRRDVKDTVYPGLFATEYTMTENPLAELSVTFKGFVDNKVPEPVLESGTRRQQVTLSFTGDTPGEVTSETMTVTYISPYTTFTYFLKSKPTAPKYRNKVELTTDSMQIVSLSGDPGRNFKFVRGGDLNGSTSGALLKGDPNSFNAAVEIHTDLGYSKIGGWYRVIESNQLQLTQLPIANNKRIIQTT